MQPGDFKRKYRFRSRTDNRLTFAIAIIVSIIAFLLIVYYL
ncbi:DMSO/TMAO reductase YedYZ heme-binding membrane subunit [Pedobacter cryoconitis]|uniref:DMSO/TMAO reductase YedYZ heme-binding membrane subunit n=1 Tax=Pedobacter cryoconitis TaxID=188932 RepID=A0A7W8ZLM4_9SPHI|nr:DMSO/TMAO reductase YedYZ heme-binding membrane subunit [Pedobacter cryoconitis]MBB6273026.1 DMSO/TMAO reductase YedYZ heme-binding membrane subunit [Pedobacter cryoconitis]